MYSACLMGKMDVVKWLFKVGAADGIHPSNHGWAPSSWLAVKVISIWRNGYSRWSPLSTFVPVTTISRPCKQLAHMVYLDLAKWLFEVGAAEDIRTRNNNGWTPILMACSEGHLDTAKWLFEVGAADNIQTGDNEGAMLIHIVCFCGNLDVAN